MNEYSVEFNIIFAVPLGTLTSDNVLIDLYAYPDKPSISCLPFAPTVGLKAVAVVVDVVLLS